MNPAVRKPLEAILLVIREPVPARTLAEVLEVATADVIAALHELAAEYRDEGRGFVLREGGGGWRLYSDPGVADYVARFVRHGRPERLSAAALETLAVVAYRQPVTRSQIAQIRGVDADGAVRSLVSRGLVRELGRDPAPGHPLLYGTTPEFLERMGLRDLDELVPLAAVAPMGPAPDEPAPGEYKAARRAGQGRGAPTQGPPAG